jgi:hypothetical protein
MRMKKNYIIGYRWNITLISVILHIVIKYTCYLLYMENSIVLSNYPDYYKTNVLFTQQHLFSICGYRLHKSYSDYRLRNAITLLNKR